MQAPAIVVIGPPPSAGLPFAVTQAAVWMSVIGFASRGGGPDRACVCAQRGFPPRMFDERHLGFGNNAAALREHHVE